MLTSEGKDGFQRHASSGDNPSGVVGVTVSNHLTFLEHIQHTISSYAQTLYAMKILRAQGVIDTVLQQVCVIVLKLQYVSCAWCGFTKASDRQRTDNFIRWDVKSGLCPADLQSFGGLCETAEEKLFNQVLNYPSTRSPSASAASVYCKPENTTSDHVNVIRNYQTKQLLLTKYYLLCMLFPHLSFRFARQRSVCCLINE